MNKGFYTDKDKSEPVIVGKGIALLESVLISSNINNKPIGVVRCLKDIKRDCVFISKLHTEPKQRSEFMAEAEKTAERLLKKWRQ